MTTVEVQPLSVSASGFSKMEDRKRPAVYDNDEVAPPPKRHVTAAVNGASRGHQDADFPGRDELEKFQKEAILRQMQEYKREKAAIETRLNDLQKRSTHHDDHIRAIDAWFSQLLDEVKVHTGNVTDTEQSTPFPTQLLSSDDKAFSKYLQSRSQDISSALERIFSGGVNATMETTELQERITKLLANEKAHLSQLEKLQSEKDQLEERLETASMRYMMAEKKLDRAKSMTVAKLERQATAGGRNESGSGLGGGVDGAKTDSGNGQVDSEALAEVEKAKNALTAISTKQAEQIKQLVSENEKLTSQLNSFKLKAASHSDEDYAHTELFKQLKLQYEDAVKKVNHLEATNTELRQEATKQQAERSAYRMQLDAEMQAAISEKELVMSRMEADLARIRNDRDEAKGKVAVLESGENQKRGTSEHFKELAFAGDERIKAMELEIERLKSADTPCDLDMAEKQWELEELRNQYAQLKRQHAMLNQELTSMGAAYKKISAISSAKILSTAELEEKVIRLTADKARSDQKYYGSMKTKEAKDNEVRALRAQNSKSSDIVSQLKDVETSTKALIVKLEKQLAESNDAMTTIQTKYRDTQCQLDQKRSQADAVKKEVDELRAVVTAKDSACATATAAQRKAELRVEELKVEVEDKNKRIETWKAKGLGSENEHYEALRSLAICTVCRRNFKDTALKSCGHVFCLQCVEDRLSNRMRKCPNCNKGFGTSEILKITL